VVNFAIFKNVIIRSTMFPHSKIVASIPTRLTSYVDEIIGDNHCMF
jgi:hypothetical protein